METFEPIKIVGVVADEITTPRNDGTDGSSLYAIPLRLSERPPAEWSEIFRHTWDRPPQWTSMHRPGIALVRGDKIILDGTTIEELEQYHRATALLAVAEANRLYVEYLAKRQAQEEREAERIRHHQENVRDRSKDIKFD